MLRDVHIYFNKIDKIAHVFINEQLKDTELSRGLFYYILALYNKDGITMRDLGKAVFADKAYTSRAVTKLVELGYITKIDNETDLRSSKIYLTNSGKEATIMINDIFVDWCNIISEGLTDKDKDAALDISRKLFENAFKYYSGVEGKK